MPTFVRPRGAHLPALLGLLLAFQLACGGDSDSLSVTITSPEADTTYVRTALTVQVFVDGDTPDSVDLLKDGEALARLPLPYQYVWDVSGLPEGTYVLTARATRGGSSVDSEPLKVVVDRTAPGLQSQTPPPDVSGEWTGAISFTASEPIDPNSLKDTTVLLRSEDGQAVRKQLVLSGDGRTVELRVDQPLPLPMQLEAVITAGVTDRAGNPLIPSRPSWSWRAPAARLLGMTPLQPERNVLAVNNPSLLLTREGHPFLAYNSVRSSNDQGEVARWNGNAWEHFSHPDLEGQNRLAMDASGNLVVASATYSQLTVRRREGDQWRLMARSFDAGDNVGNIDIGMQLAVRRDGAAVMTWNRSWGAEYQSTIARVLSVSPEGGRAELGSFPDARIHALAIDASGIPWLAMSPGKSERGLRVGRLIRGGFEPVGGVLETEAGSATPARIADLKLDEAGRPIVAWRNQDLLYVHAWDGTRWSALGEPRPAGGPLLGASNALALALAPGNRPVVAWVWDSGVGDLNELRVESWTGAAWEPRMAPQAALYFHGVALAVDGAGRPVVAWYNSEASRRAPLLQVRAGF